MLNYYKNKRNRKTDVIINYVRKKKENDYLRLMARYLLRFL